ncbi:MAG TPA: metallophosphoesterase [Candidatus Binatia bacterium]|nr:metallophosphoesterase [Candidatus Binatia bacterium]
MNSYPEAVIVHSSDLHLGVDDSFSNSDSLAVLPKVLTTAAAVNADVVLLAGDTFDNHRQPLELLERAAQMMRDYQRPIVILPGNHDPLTPDSVYRRGGLSEIVNVRILGLNVDQAVTFSQFELEIWGRAHLDYADMSPLADPRPRSTRWQLAAAHGHYVDEARDPNRLIGSWLIHREELIATGSDYIALGHWNQATPVGTGEVAAFYSGSPEYAGTVNVIRLRGNGQVEISQVPLNGSAK